MVTIETADGRTAEVPAKALSPDSPAGASWWEKVATGSVVLLDWVLDTLLRLTGQNNNEA